MGRTQFEQAAKGENWDQAADQLNGLAMFDMLPALAGLGGKGQKAVDETVAVLSSRGWTGSAARIRWAGEVVKSRRLPTWRPGDLPEDQVKDAQRFLNASRPASPPAGKIDAGAAQAEVMKAVRSGLIKGNGASQLLEFEKNGTVKSKKGNQAAISPFVFVLLQGLIKGNRSVTVMNIARPDDKRTSPHGRAPSDSSERTSFAIDIRAYDGDTIELRPDGMNVDPTIRAVSGILQNLPPGGYKFGFPRPSTHLGGPVFPDFDVFLPADTPSDIERPPPGKLGKDAIPLIKVDAAREAVTRALDANPKARFSMFFPDGFDHAHIEIIP